MPIELKYDATIDGMLMKATGKVVYDDLPPLAKLLLAHPDFRTNINQLFDCTEGKLQLSSDDLRRIAYDFKQIEGELGQERRLALAVSRTVDFGMMRQYEFFFKSGPGVMIRSFRSLHEAKQWLQSD